MPADLPPQDAERLQVLEEMLRSRNTNNPHYHCNSLWLAKQERDAVDWAVRLLRSRAATIQQVEALRKARIANTLPSSSTCSAYCDAIEDVLALLQQEAAE